MSTAAHQLADELIAELQALHAESLRLVSNPDLRWSYRLEDRQMRKNVLTRMVELKLIPRAKLHGVFTLC